MNVFRHSKSKGIWDSCTFWLWLLHNKIFGNANSFLFCVFISSFLFSLLSVRGVVVVLLLPSIFIRLTPIAKSGPLRVILLSAIILWVYGIFGRGSSRRWRRRVAAIVSSSSKFLAVTRDGLLAKEACRGHAPGLFRARAIALGSLLASHKQLAHCLRVWPWPSTFTINNSFIKKLR